MKIKEKVSFSIILVDGFRNILQMNSAINKEIDFISMSRPFICDKDFLESLKNNQNSKCISCNKCFEIYKTKYKHCIFDDNVNVQLYENFYK